MINECSFANVQPFFEARKVDKNIVIVWVGYNDPPKYKKKFDHIMTELAPEQYPLYIEKREHFERIADSMRAWGPTPEERKIRAGFKAFIEACGRNGIYYRRHLGMVESAPSVSALKRLVESGKTVILVSDGEGVPDHRFILMQMIGPWRSMRRMMQELKRPKMDMEFAKSLEEGKAF